MSGRPAAQPLDLEAAADPAGRDLERMRPPAGLEGDELAVEHGRADGQRQRGRDHLGHAGGDVVQGPGEHAHLGPSPVHLDAGPVQLPLDGRPPPPSPWPPRRWWRSRPASAGGGGRPPGGTGAAPGTPPARAAAATGPRAPRSMKARRTSAGDPGGPGHGLDHHPLQGALAQLAGEQARPGTAARSRWPGRTARPAAAAAPPATRAGQRADPLEGGVDLGDGQGRGGRRVGRVPQRRPADPDLALAQLAGEERHRRVDLARLQAPQARRQPLHLGQAGGAGGDGGGRPGDLVEQHGAILLDRPTTGTGLAGRAAVG